MSQTDPYDMLLSTGSKWKRVANIKATQASIANVNELYELSVQSPKREVANLLMMHRKINMEIGSERYIAPHLLREDFCGTAILCSAWLARHTENRAICINLDHKVLSYAKKTYFASTESASRIQILCENVLNVSSSCPNLPRVDIIAALNYSICYFHTRLPFLSYLSSISKHCLTVGGIFVCDIFGGTDYYSKSSVNTVRSVNNFKYIFEQSDFDHFTNRIACAMHFKFKDGSAIKNAFRYDFRIWSICEVKELLVDAGFTFVYAWIRRQFKHQGESQDEDTYHDNNANSAFQFYQIFPIADGPLPSAGMELWNAYIVGV